MKKIQLTIPKPCHESWDQMTPQDKGRFCAACQKTVVDFTMMSDRQIAEFFRKPSGSVCGHFHQDQLEREIDASRKRIPWIKYFFQISLPALLVSTKATAQGMVMPKGKTECVPDSSSRPTMTLRGQVEETGIIEGKVFDENGVPIPSATIMIRGTKNGTAASDSGTFTLKTPLFATLEISSVGFLSRSVVVTDFSSRTIILQKSPESFAGEVVITTRKRYKKNKVAVPVAAKVVDTAFKNFKVFPSPARNNSIMKIDCNKLEQGEYVLSVIDMNGEILQTQEVFVDKKKTTIEFFLENAKAGTYIIHFFNRKTTASYSEKIIVQ